MSPFLFNLISNHLLIHPVLSVTTNRPKSTVLLLSLRRRPPPWFMMSYFTGRSVFSFFPSLTGELCHMLSYWICCLCRWPYGWLCKVPRTMTGGVTKTFITTFNLLDRERQSYSLLALTLNTRSIFLSDTLNHSIDVHCEVLGRELELHH